MKNVHAHIGSQEEKIVNISRLVKLLQSYSDAQEEDSQNVKNQMKSLNQRVDEVIGGAHHVFNYQSNLGHH